MGYGGFVTVEQERDPRSAGGSLADVRASRDYLKSVGF
jgi:inosose dehydratase